MEDNPDAPSVPEADNVILLNAHKVSGRHTQVTAALTMTMSC